MLSGCVSERAAEAKMVTLPVGTEVELVLLKELTSGGSKEGEQVPLLVSQDVKDAQGQVLIPRGAIAYGKVVWSRGATTFTALANQPARLAISINSTYAIDDKLVPLAADLNDPDKPHQFTRSNTAVQSAREELEKLFASEDSKAVLEKIKSAFEDGQVPEFDSNDVFLHIAEEMGMNSTKELAQKGKLGMITSTLEEIQRGGLTRISGGEAALLIGAVTEVAQLGGQVGSKIAGMLKGANIKAHPGTPVIAYTLHPVDVRVNARAEK